MLFRSVGEDGRVRYAALEQGSGETDIDARAVALAREFRFEPRAAATANPEIEWGLVRFYWAFVSPSAANGQPADAANP